MLDIYKGANGLLVNNKVLFIIETKKVNKPTDWLFKAAEKFGINKQDCKIIENNPTSDKHHLCHAYAAYSQSGFKDASILIIDGMNEPNGISIAIFKAENDKIELIKSSAALISTKNFEQMKLF